MNLTTVRHKFKPGDRVLSCGEGDVYIVCEVLTATASLSIDGKNQVAYGLRYYNGDDYQYITREERDLHLMPATLPLPEPA